MGPRGDWIAPASTRRPPAWHGARRGFARERYQIPPEAFDVEGLLTAQHPVHGAAELGGQDAQGLALAALLLQTRHEALGLVALAQQHMLATVF
jgi:hypothetical protein